MKILLYCFISLLPFSVSTNAKAMDKTITLNDGDTRVVVDMSMNEYSPGSASQSVQNTLRFYRLGKSGSIPIHVMCSPEGGEVFLGEGVHLWVLSDVFTARSTVIDQLGYAMCSRFDRKYQLGWYADFQEEQKRLNAMRAIQRLQMLGW